MKRQDRIEERYRRNIDSLPACSDYVYSQHAPACKDLLFGDKGNVGANGCAAVAVHNVMKYIGRPQNFCDVLRDMEELHMTWLGARFGTKPWALGRYFWKKNIPFSKYKSPNDFKAALLTHPAGIVCTWNKRFYGMHFFCVYFNAEEGKYYTTNFSSGNGFRQMEIGEISNLRFVNGYIIHNME